MNIFSFHVKRIFPNSPFFHFTRTNYGAQASLGAQHSSIPTFQLRSAQVLITRQLNITALHSQFIFLKSINLTHSVRDGSRVGSLFRMQHLVEILLLSLSLFQ